MCWNSPGVRALAGVGCVIVAKNASEGVQEWDQAEIDDFTKKFWPADLFFDESRKIFTSLTDGQETKLSLLQLANPFSAAWKAARKAKQTVTDSNLKVLPHPMHSNWSSSSLV